MRTVATYGTITLNLVASVPAVTNVESADSRLGGLVEIAKSTMPCFAGRDISHARLNDQKPFPADQVFINGFLWKRISDCIPSSEYYTRINKLSPRAGLASETIVHKGVDSSPLIPTRSSSLVVVNQLTLVTESDAGSLPVL
jgi:hypothetical protein